MFTLDNPFLLLTGLLAAYLCWYFYQRNNLNKALHNLYYLMGFAVLLALGLLLIFLGLGILASPYVLTVASLIPLGISMGIAEQYYPAWKKYFKWFATIGFLAITISSFANIELLRKIPVPLFHGVAGLVIFLAPFFATSFRQGKKAVKRLLDGGRGRRADWDRRHCPRFPAIGKPLLGIFTTDLVFNILSPLLLLMTLALTYGFVRDFKH